MKNLAYFLGIFLLALLLYIGLMQEKAEHRTAVFVGSKAPDFVLKSLDGQEVRLSDYRGKVVLVNFWASWCPPCRAEMPLFEDIYKRYKDKGFLILAISTDVNEEAVHKFLKDIKVSFPVLMDDGKVSETYGITGLPTSFLIGRDGKVVRIRLGEYKELETDLKGLF